MKTSIERMKAEEHENLVIRYGFISNPFGKMLAAFSPKGLCYLIFADDREVSISHLKKKFPKAELIFQEEMNFEPSNESELKLHLSGTDFQLQVWNALLNIPAGEHTTYGKIAQAINHPKACRAVGTAVGDNPIALLIPCHRVVRTSGALGGYRWCTARKAAILNQEKNAQLE